MYVSPGCVFCFFVFFFFYLFLVINSFFDKFLHAYDAFCSLQPILLLLTSFPYPPPLFPANFSLICIFSLFLYSSWFGWSLLCGFWNWNYPLETVGFTKGEGMAEDNGYHSQTWSVFNSLVVKYRNSQASPPLMNDCWRYIFCSTSGNKHFYF